ncbi:MAG TPA: PEP-CTERM sorting domain-containing protein [Terracidiphilus sp.]|nr:PEP-CTERM sorting domain-containing protein [Terracidiphilus sp.]
MKNTGRISLLSIALLAALACATPARADDFNYDFILTDGSSNTFNLTETITADSLGGGYYGITAVNGTITNVISFPLDGYAELYDWTGSGDYGATGNFYSITTYAGNHTYMAYDNILNLSGSGPIFSEYGEYFTFGSETYYVNLFYNPPSDVGPLNPYPGYSWFAVEVTGPSTYTDVDFGTFTIVPEPSTWLLLGSGLLMLAGLAWKSRREGLNASFYFERVSALLMRGCPVCALSAYLSQTSGSIYNY